MEQKFNAKNFEDVVENEFGIIGRNKINCYISKFSFFNKKGELLFVKDALDDMGIFPFEINKNYVINTLSKIIYHLDGTKFNTDGEIHSFANNNKYVLLENNNNYILYDIDNKKTVYNTKNDFEKISQQAENNNKEINNKYINLFADNLNKKFNKILNCSSLNIRDIVYIKSSLNKSIEKIRITYKTNNEFNPSKCEIELPRTNSEELENIIESFNGSIYNWVNDNFYYVGYVIGDNKLDIVLYQRSIPLAKNINKELRNRKFANTNSFVGYNAKKLFTLNLNTGKTISYNSKNIDKNELSM